MCVSTKSRTWAKVIMSPRRGRCRATSFNSFKHSWNCQQQDHKTFNTVSEWVRFIIPLGHYRSLREQGFPGNWLCWHWQPNIMHKENYKQYLTSDRMLMFCSIFILKALLCITQTFKIPVHTGHSRYRRPATHVELGQSKGQQVDNLPGLGTIKPRDKTVVHNTA